MNAATFFYAMPRAFCTTAIRSIPRLRYPAKPISQSSGLLYPLHASHPFKPLLREQPTTFHQNRPTPLPPTSSNMSIPYADIPMMVKDWITEHPYQSVLYTFNSVVLVTPAAATVPVFYMLGFTALGPGGGT